MPVHQVWTRIVTAGPGRVPLMQCDRPVASMIVNWPSPRTRVSTLTSNIVVPRGNDLSSVRKLLPQLTWLLGEMLSQMAISRQRGFKAKNEHTKPILKL